MQSQEKKSVAYIKHKLLKYLIYGHEPWSSGYGMRLMFWRSWVWIPAPYTGWTFFHIKLLLKNATFVWKWQKINKKRPGIGPFKKYIEYWSASRLRRLNSLIKAAAFFALKRSSTMGHNFSKTKLSPRNSPISIVSSLELKLFPKNAFSLIQFTVLVYL